MGIPCLGVRCSAPYGWWRVLCREANATGFILAAEYDDNYKQLMDKVVAIQAAVTLPEVLPNGNNKDMEG